MTLTIDEQFKNIIPPLSPDEYDKLKENILLEGIRDRLVIWNDILIDGHNRYKIATECSLPFETVSKDFESREHVLNWIISNQLGRRNLTEAQKMYLRGKRYETEKKLYGGQGKNQYNKVQVSHNETPAQISRTDSRIGAEYNVGRSTIMRDFQYARAVDAMPPDTKEKILSGEEKVSKNDMMEFARLEAPTQKKVVSEIKKGTPVADAIKYADPEIKRMENDERIRKQIDKNIEMRNKTRFSQNAIHIRSDVTICSKAEFISNEESFNEKIEVWAFNDPEIAHLAKIELRKIMDLKFNE
ncbi:MAG: hypothetical protein LLG05_14105 [Porphyromonadaceae bacterium]|nr:hypothetical protein [Porphyromonadaceae bacterium]